MARKDSSEARILAAVRRACVWSERQVHADSKRRLAALATIAATAPFVGLLGTTMGIMGAFRGCGATRAVCMAATVTNIQEALLSTALGLVVAIPAVWGYNYFTRRLGAIDLETATVTSILTNDVALALAAARNARRS
jgi:biopolymer transport protein ExbB